MFCLTNSLVRNQAPVSPSPLTWGVGGNPYYYYRNYSILLVLIKRVLSPLNNRFSRDSMLTIRSLGENRLPANQNLTEGGLMQLFLPYKKYSIQHCSGLQWI